MRLALSAVLALTSFFLTSLIAAPALAQAGSPATGLAADRAPDLAGPPPGDQMTARDLDRILRRIQKPGIGDSGTSPVGAQYRGDDTCRWANDGECDDPGIGTGACQEFTDYSDCWRVATGVEDNSCQWANDGECDEPGFGTGACTQATDLNDCREFIHLRGQRDSCEHAFNGVCNEPGVGDGACAVRTDRSDCVGRERPLDINDHFFGHDDRVVLDTAEFPWAAVGQIDMDSGGACTATLIASDILITAGHCISGQSGVDARGVFTTAYRRPGGPLTARVVDYFMDPDWDRERFSAGNDLDYTDWALLRIDTPLGDIVGHAVPGRMHDYLDAIAPDATTPGTGRKGPGGGVQPSLDDQLAGAPSQRRSGEFTLVQGGYSWDTGANLSGNIGCFVVELFNDATMAHDCDTTRGDSGSPFMVRDGEDYVVLATDSNFRQNPNGPTLYVAVRSEAWFDYFEPFQRGEIGSGGPRPAGPGKPPKG